MIPFVGLTGGVASGKTTAAAHFTSLGVPVVDADDIGHFLYEAGGKVVRQIRREFGAEFIAEGGEVDRGLLRQEVFADVRLRKRLEAITHPLIRKECMLQMNAARGTYGLLVAPLMFETNFMLEHLQRVLVVDCDEQTQLAHGLERGISSEHMELVMKVQYNRAARLKRADDVMINNGNLTELDAMVSDMHQRYITMFTN